MQMRYFRWVLGLSQWTKICLLGDDTKLGEYSLSAGKGLCEAGARSRGVEHLLKCCGMSGWTSEWYLIINR